MLKTLLKEAEREITKECDLWLTKHTKSEGAYLGYIELDPTWTRIDRVIRNGKQLTLTTEYDVEQNINDELPDGEPLSYYVQMVGRDWDQDNEEHVVVDRPRIMFDKKGDTDNIDIYAYESIQPSDQSTSKPRIPDNYHTDLCYYAVALSSAKSNLELYQTNIMLWVDGLDKIKIKLEDQGGYIHQIRSEV